MATLSIVESVDAFVETIEKSGLLSADAMSKVRELAAKAENPKALARPLVKDGTLTNWQANQLLYGFHKLVIGKYKLLNQLGAGEMGRVYLAEHVQMARRHCLKVLSRRHTSKPDVLKRFLDEAQGVCALEHRNLSHVYDVNQDGNQYYLVMEYVEGQDLQSQVAKAGKLPVAESLEYVRQTAEGLAHAHEQGVVHGDLKPSNLVLDEGGTIKILEIGQARLAEGPQGPIDKDETAETSSLAAAIYHAPEQRGQTRSIDRRSDIYSLGSVLVYLLTGKAAPDALAADSQLKQVAKLPESLQKLAVRMMAESPDDRPANMKAVLSELGTVERERSLPPKPAAKTPDAKPAAEAKPPAKGKKPPVAKALTESAALPIAKSLEAPTAAEPETEEEPSPFAGFAIQTKGTPGSRKPPVKSPAGEGPVVAVSTSSGTAAAAKKSYLPLILGGSIGGGVLALAGISLIVYLVFFRGSGEPTEVAQAPAATSAAAPGETAPEGNPTETTAGESNPAAESNPASESNPAATAPTETKPPEGVATPEATGTATPMPAPVNPTDPPMPAPTPEVKPTETEPPATTPTEAPMPVPSPAPMPEPPKTTPKPVAPVGNPLEGFAKAVSLPKLGSAMSDLPPEALAPKALGPCKVDPSILVVTHLRGGEFAARGGRQKFEMAAANNGTAKQDWEVNLTGPEGAVLVAKLGVKEGNLTFQWTPEGAKEANAPYLANCALELSAGTGRHVVALREPVVGPPLVIELEKPGSAKWLVDHLPDPKSIHFEVTELEGMPRKKFDGDINVLRGVGEDMTVWTGPDDETMPLGIRLTSGISGKNVQVTSAPWLKFEGMKKAEKYSKKILAANKAGATQRLSVLTQQREALPKGEQTEAQRNLLDQEIQALSKGTSQVDAITEFIDKLKGVGKIHFRVFYAAEEGAQVDLLVTSNEPAAPEKDAKK
jgi:serine/threonine-protein kinase